MKNFITLRFARIGLLGILAAVILFHLLVIAGIIPYDIVWGGRLKNHADMLRFETVSVLINLVMLGVVAADSGFIPFLSARWILKGALWLMFLLFLANTAGNLLSVNQLEKILFTPLTFLLSVFSLRLALEK